MEWSEFVERVNTFLGDVDPDATTVPVDVDDPSIVWSICSQSIYRARKRNVILKANRDAFEFATYPFEYVPMDHGRNITLRMVKMLNTLYVCIALHICQSPLDDESLCVVFNLLQTQLHFMTSWMSVDKPDADMFFVEIVERAFPGQLSRWFDIVFRVVTSHSKRILAALGSLLQQDMSRLTSVPKEITMQDERKLTLSPVPSPWTLNSETAMLSFAFSPYLTYPRALPFISAWLDRVSPGCTQSPGWPFLLAMAKANLEPSTYGFSTSRPWNFIRGLWTHVVVSMHHPEMTLVQRALNYYNSDKQDSKDAALCLAVDALSLFISMYAAVEDSIYVNWQQMPEFRSISFAVYDFHSPLPLEGLGWTTAPIRRYYYSLASNGNVRQIAALVASWIKKMADIERSHPPGTPPRYVSWRANVPILLRDARVDRAVYLLSTTSNFYAHDMKPWMNVNRDMEEILSGPEPADVDYKNLPPPLLPWQEAVKKVYKDPEDWIETMNFAGDFVSEM